MSQNAPTVSWIIPLFNVLFDHVEDVADDNNQPKFIREAAIQTRNKLEEYYSKTNATTMLCTSLDPRHKLSYFKRNNFSREWIDKVESL
jgi:hypothetical protein